MSREEEANQIAEEIRLYLAAAETVQEVEADGEGLKGLITRIILNRKYPEVLKFVRDCLKYYRDSPREQRFVHYMGSLSNLREQIEKGWYEPLKTGEDGIPLPSCKCKNAAGEYSHDHTLVSTLLTERQIQGRRYRAKKAETISANETANTCKNIKNMYHFLSTVLYILCERSTTNLKEHEHYENIPFSISYKLKQELSLLLVEENNLEELREEFINGSHSIFGPKKRAAQYRLKRMIAANAKKIKL